MGHLNLPKRIHESPANEHGLYTPAWYPRLVERYGNMDSMPKVVADIFSPSNWKLKHNRLKDEVLSVSDEILTRPNAVVIIENDNGIEEIISTIKRMK